MVNTLFCKIIDFKTKILIELYTIMLVNIKVSYKKFDILILRIFLLSFKI